jgi:predicted Rossmann fold nucleotide-binding protein DprA/Smf involved in DNA uptake
VTCTADILETFGIEPAKPPAVSPGPIAERLYARLSEGAFTADELVRICAVDPGQGAAALFELELAGRVTLEDGAYRAGI